MVDVDIVFDEELHDDEDFMKTLDQLDGPNVKKVSAFKYYIVINEQVTLVAMCVMS